MECPTCKHEMYAHLVGNEWVMVCPMYHAKPKQEKTMPDAWTTEVPKVDGWYPILFDDGKKTVIYYECGENGLPRCRYGPRLEIHWPRPPMTPEEKAIASKIAAYVKENYHLAYGPLTRAIEKGEWK